MAGVATQASSSSSALSLSWQTVRRAGTVAAAAGVAAGVVTLFVRQVAWSSRVPVALTAATPWLGSLPVAGTVVAAACRSRLVAVAGLAVSAVFAGTQLPLYVGGPGVDGPAVPLVVLTSNLRFGDADEDQLVSLVRDRSVDVLTVQELTPDAVDRLREAGLEDLLPFSQLAPGWGATGTGLWSRYPLTDGPHPNGQFQNQQVVATVTVTTGPAAGQTITVASLHPQSPWPDGSGRWSTEMEELVRWADTLAGPVVLAGDFNSTPDHRQMRDFHGEGYIDSVERAGAGFLPTYPTDKGTPPMIAIDHVLTRGGPVANAASSITIRDSDHRAVLVTVAVPVAQGGRTQG